MTPTHRSAPRVGPLLDLLMPVVAWIAGVLGMVAIWTAVSLALRSPAGWLALVAAADMALLMRLSGLRAGPGRAWAALGGTAVAIVLGYWFQAAVSMGVLLGLQPMESALRIGPVLAWDLVRLGSSGWDLLWAALALPLAWRLAR